MSAGRLEQFPFLDADACADVVRTAERNPDLTVDRRPDRPGEFVTYGRSAYLDVCPGDAAPEQNYYRLLADTNAGLWKAFEGLYHRLRQTLADELGEPVGYRPDDLALPGLHVFRGSAIALADHASAHFDQQYGSLRLPAPRDPGVPPLTVTVPLRMPSNGTGLIVYDVEPDRYRAAVARGAATSLESYARRRTRAYHPYTLGSMVLHRGLLMHQLSSPGPIVAGDERITLQGHAIRCGGEWILYW
ncbi:hypothetical protein [Kitasatospora sp. NPDC085879]|uniref:hypothetical protein n=1 Tax=Kitasatospora sp. NPDC085879 TaxID=3154769 RepID=UPI0034492D62